MNKISTIHELATALENHPINAGDMRGDYQYHLAGINAEVGQISRLTTSRGSLTSEESRQLGLSIGTSLLLLASIANSESLDLPAILTQAISEL